MDTLIPRFPFPKFFPENSRPLIGGCGNFGKTLEFPNKPVFGNFGKRDEGGRDAWNT